MAKHELPEGCYSEGGKGKKQCPSCSNFIAARAAVCPNSDCGHVFVAKEKKVAQQRTIQTVEDDPAPRPMAPAARPFGFPPRKSEFAAQLEAVKAAKKLAEELGGVDELVKVLELLD